MLQRLGQTLFGTFRNSAGNAAYPAHKNRGHARNGGVRRLVGDE